LRRSCRALARRKLAGAGAGGREELRVRLLELDRRITDYDHRIEQLAKQNEATRRLMQVEGVDRSRRRRWWPRLAKGTPFNTAAVRSLAGARAKQHSTGERRCGTITKHGNVYLRTLLIHGARAVLQFSAKRTDRKSCWVEQYVDGGNNIAA